jgi:hypothetical protein
MNLVGLRIGLRLNIKYGFNPDGIKRKTNSIGQAGQAKGGVLQRSRSGYRVESLGRISGRLHFLSQVIG